MPRHVPSPMWMAVWLVETKAPTGQTGIEPVVVPSGIQPMLGGPTRGAETSLGLTPAPQGRTLAAKTVVVPAGIRSK